MDAARRLPSLPGRMVLASLSLQPMTLLRPTLLVLAWDDADPAAGGPATLHLVRALAEHQPVLALLPHLPEGARSVLTHELPESAPLLAPKIGPEGEEPAIVEAAPEEPVTKPELVEAAMAPAARGLAAVIKKVSETETALATLEEAVHLATELIAPAPSDDLATLLDPDQNYGLRVVGLGDLSPAQLAEVGIEVEQRVAEVAQVVPIEPSALEVISQIEPAATPPAVVAPEVYTPVKTEVALRQPLAEKLAALQAAWQEPAAPYIGSTVGTVVASPRAAEITGVAADITEASQPATEPLPEPEASVPLHDALNVELSTPLTLIASPEANAAPIALPLESLLTLPIEHAPETDLPLDEVDFSDFEASETNSPAEQAFLTEEPASEVGSEGNSELPEPTLVEGNTPVPAPDDELAPSETLALATLTDALASLRQPAPIAAAPAIPSPFEHADALHYRIIQYARFASYLAATEMAGFEAIYAPNWPTWLAAAEIGYRHRRPLVLHISALAIDEATPAGRGWLLELERSTLRRAHTVLVATAELREQVLAHYELLKPQQVQVVAIDDVEGVQAVLTLVADEAQVRALVAGQELYLFRN